MLGSSILYYDFFKADSWLALPYQASNLVFERAVTIFPWYKRALLWGNVNFGLEWIFTKGTPWWSVTKANESVACSNIFIQPEKHFGAVHWTNQSSQSPLFQTKVMAKLNLCYDPTLNNNSLILWECVNSWQIREDMFELIWLRTRKYLGVAWSILNLCSC